MPETASRLDHVYRSVRLPSPSPRGTLWHMLRTAHGARAGNLLCVEVSPPDELPTGVPDPNPVHAGPADQGADGRFRPGNRLSARGGRAKAGKVGLSSRLGLAELAHDATFAPYRRLAVSFRRAQCQSLAQTVGGGYCGPGPSSIVASAALALAWSRYLSDKAITTGDNDLAMKASSLAERSRTALLTAHELCAREAAARPKRSVMDSFVESLSAPTPDADGG